MADWTIQKLLGWMTEYFDTHGVDSARLSAEMLISHVLGVKRITLYTDFNKVVAQENLITLRGLVKRAADQEPIAYLVGKTGFYSMEFDVSQDCLIPRPETEMLVERAIEFLRPRSKETSQMVCDLCTGSGCIAAAIANGTENVKIIATDICDAALEIAAGNVAKHGLSDRVELRAGDLFEPILHFIDEGKFDVIVSNPPYVSAGEYEGLDKNVRDFEPAKALLAGDQGLDVYHRIVEKVDEFLKPGGALIMEIGYAQGDAVRQMLEGIGCFESVKVEKDHNDNDRVVTAVKEL